ncbi:hypothetical protein HYE67_007522 [Fusarium culmorum]|uniref:Uncharacterized protein n=1 Tax=Fusarium culmorum TaxID=5516 RepID=A0A2T4H3C8_FUSCU|nr:hypothetical protein FCULG_00008615 [Fusarium culmorum]QPC65291.1 hypothetical protein HYE67_007522 [Fusarium culmorum]
MKWKIGNLTDEGSKGKLHYIKSLDSVGPQDIPPGLKHQKLIQTSEKGHCSRENVWPAFVCLQSIVRLNSLFWEIIDVPTRFALFQSRENQGSSGSTGATVVPTMIIISIPDQNHDVEDQILRLRSFQVSHRLLSHLFPHMQSVLNTFTYLPASVSTHGREIINWYELPPLHQNQGRASQAALMWPSGDWSSLTNCRTISSYGFRTCMVETRYNATRNHRVMCGDRFETIDPGRDISE